MPVCPILVPLGKRRFTRATARALVTPDGLSSKRAPERVDGTISGAPGFVAEIHEAS